MSRSWFGRVVPMVGVSVLVVGVAGGCHRQHQVPQIRLPPTAVLSLRFRWGVITENLLRVRERPSKQSPTILHVRKGTIVEIISRTDKKESVEGHEAYWYLIDYSGLKGWVFGAYLEVAGTRGEAERLAREFR